MNDCWNDDWRTELRQEDPELMNRLANCTNKTRDLKVIAKIMWKYNQSRTKEECLDRTIAWLTDWNNQVELIPDSEEYKKILEFM